MTAIRTVRCCRAVTNFALAFHSGATVSGGAENTASNGCDAAATPRAAPRSCLYMAGGGGVGGWGATMYRWPSGWQEDWYRERVYTCTCTCMSPCVSPCDFRTLVDSFAAVGGGSKNAASGMCVSFASCDSPLLFNKLRRRYLLGSSGAAPRFVGSGGSACN
jgi:hypothetical protein